MINPSITDQDLIIAGKEIAKKAQQPNQLLKIVNIMILPICEIAQENAKEKIKLFVKPIFSAYKNSGVAYERSSGYERVLGKFNLNKSYINNIKQSILK